MILDCKDPYLLEWALKFNNTSQTNGHTMNCQKRRPSLKPENIYALAYKDVSEK